MIRFFFRHLHNWALRLGLCLSIVHSPSVFGTDGCGVIYLGEPPVLRELRKEGWKPLEGEGPEGKWDIDGPENAFYLRELGDIIEKAEGQKYLTFQSILENRIQNGEGTNVLDLFGSGFFIKPPEMDIMGMDVDSVTGLRYGRYDLSLLPPKYPLAKLPKEILGDALSPMTWGKLDSSMLERKISKMDLVVMRPYGGWERADFAQTARGNLLAITYILENVINRLSPTGRFYFTVNIRQLDGTLSEQAEFKQLVSKIEALTNFKLILVSRTSNNGTTFGLEGALVPKKDIPREYLPN